MTLVLDTSALCAVVFGEREAELLVRAMVPSVGDLHLSAVSLVEAGIVVEARLGPEGTQDLHLLLRTLQVAIVPVDADQAELATAAWRRFGKGRHPAGLNLGDCFAYALARRLGAPLLFVGSDFDQTDVSTP